VGWAGPRESRRLVPTKRSSASADLLEFEEEEEMFMVDELEEAGGTEGESGAEGVGTRREGSLVTIGAGIGLRYPLISLKDSGLTVIGPATGATPTGTLEEEGTWVEQLQVYAQRRLPDLTISRRCWRRYLRTYGRYILQGFTRFKGEQHCIGVGYGKEEMRREEETVNCAINASGIGNTGLFNIAQACGLSAPTFRTKSEAFRFPRRSIISTLIVHSRNELNS
jgi:hypothetical protein